jgi:preprotein translocase subunit SecG
MGSLGLTFFWLLLLLTSIFMILLILIQRGRGGGITGALGGAGGQSAFGSKTGDVFTKITVYTAIIWIMLSILTISFFNRPLDPDPIAKPPGTTTTAPGTGKIGEESDGEAPLPGTSLDAGGTDLPKTDETKSEDSSKSDPPLTETPKADETKTELPKTDEPKADAPKTPDATGEQTPASKEGSEQPKTDGDKQPGGGK